MHTLPRLTLKNRRPLAGFAALAAFCFLHVTSGYAQALVEADNPKGAPTAPVATPKSDKDVVMLTPFEVSTTEDRGYQAQSSLGGSRVATPLKNIASPTTAFTEQFLRDTAITNTDDLARFMLSTEYNFGEDTGGQNSLGPSNRSLRVRGLPGGTYSVNFFKNDLRGDTFSLDRIDQSRGPNSVLFGIGNPGGIVNLTTKRALLNTAKGYISGRGTTEDGARAEVDYNQPILKDHLAIRIAGVNTKEGSWRNYEYDDQVRYFATIKWQIDRRTQLNLEVEKGDIDKDTKRTVTGYDAYTNWVGAGSNLSATANAALQVQRIAGANVPDIIFDTAAYQINNWVNKTSSMLRTTLDAEPVPLTDFHLIPKQITFYGPGYDQETSYDRTSAYLEHAFTSDWNLEVAAMRMDRHGQVWDPQGAPQNYLKVDTNPTLPSGAINPNAGKPYLESLTQVNNTASRDDSLRAIMSYHFDLGWAGKHTVAGVFEADYGHSSQYLGRESVISANAPNVAQPDNVNNRVYRRTYVNVGGPSQYIVMRNFQVQPIQGLVDPNTGIAYSTAWIPFNTNTQLNSYKGTSSIGMLQSTFWHDRINTVVGGSYDARTDYLGTQVRVPLQNFTGGVLQAQRNHTGTDSHSNSFSFSGFLHVTDWLGLTYSRAENSALPSFAGRLNSPDGSYPYSRPPTPRGKSSDYGVKLDVWKHKIFLTAEYFNTSDVRDFDFTPLIATTINPIWTTLQLAGVPVPTGYTYDSILTPTGAPTITDITTGATFDAQTHGVELEMTANPTDHWRIFLNWSHEKTTHTNIGPEELAYVARWRPLWLANSAVPLSTGIGTVGSQVAAVDNAILANYILADGKEPYGQQKDKFNLRTSYDFVGGWQNGFSLGGGARFTSAPVTGYFSSLDSTGKVVAQVYRGSEQIFFDGNFGYRRRASLHGHAITWSVQVNANNVFNNQAFQRLRVSTANELELYRFNAPREWYLTTRVDF